MAEELLGCWKLVSSDNFDGYLKELGVNMATRMFVGTLKPEVHICKNGDKWSIKTVSSFQTTDVCFKLNEEFSEITPDKRKCKVRIITRHVQKE
uniref:Cytosolic fatty-acid binding proteins domain-containing protein n=1 Tax=Pyxicephalus adspersus TaxID=30357 RepID=A0AAV3ACB7_PYXAD|nr:TPA: hypothetical protein GDO54_011870 [Pyxicephalus adspersus]